MDTSTTEQLEVECANFLTELGLSKYEAYVFVDLIRLGSGTAADVAAMDHVPRTRVYDAVDTLHERGLVDIQYTSPRKYTPVSRETAVRKLDVDRENTIASLHELLGQLEPADPQPPEEFGVWTVTGADAVRTRVLEFIDDAEREIIYMAVDEVVTDGHLEALRDAAERGVTVYVAGVTDAVIDRVRDFVPDATFFETLWAWSESGAGSLLITDERTALVSVLVGADGAAPADEIAIWGTGDMNSLVVVLRTIFTWRLKGDGADRAV